MKPAVGVVAWENQEKLTGRLTLSLWLFSSKEEHDHINPGSWLIASPLVDISITHHVRHSMHTRMQSLQPQCMCHHCLLSAPRLSVKHNAAFMYNAADTHTQRVQSCPCQLMNRSVLGGVRVRCCRKHATHRDIKNTWEKRTSTPTRQNMKTYLHWLDYFQRFYGPAGRQKCSV